jgi:alanine dehydrogenase
MVVGIPKEVKDNEFRVALTPNAVKHLIALGQEVLLENGAGEGSGFLDQEYQEAGARLMSTPDELFQSAELILKVKEPQPEEYSKFHVHHILFTYLHLAASKELTEALLQSGCTAIAYETAQDANGRFPILKPMSRIAGRMSVQIGAHYLEKQQGGRGVLLGGVPGVEPGRVVILGSGGVGSSATRIAVGMGAAVTVISLDLDQLTRLEELYPGRLVTCVSTPIGIEEAVVQADLVIGAVLIPGARTPRLIPRSLVKRMRPGSVIVDVAVDQGGCAETTHPTTHSDPVYRVYDVIHYAVSNIPGIVPRTATLALTNATLPFIVRLVESGIDQALKREPGLANGVNVRQGKVTCQAVAQAHGLPFEPLD